MAKRKVVRCEFCKKGIDHMIVTLVNGDVHVHAPFDNKDLMKIFQDGIETEMNKRVQGDKKWTE